jgi:hypothetical protein
VNGRRQTAKITRSDRADDGSEEIGLMAIPCGLPVEVRFFCGRARMFSFLGGLLVVLMAIFRDFSQRIEQAMDWAGDGLIQLCFGPLNLNDESSEQAIAAARFAAGPPRDWWRKLQSLVRPPSLALVRVPSRRSVR